MFLLEIETAPDSTEGLLIKHHLTWVLCLADRPGASNEMLHYGGDWRFAK